MPRMLRDIVRDVLAQDPAFEVVGEVPWSLDLTLAARSFDAEVVIAGATASDAPTIGRLLEARPKARVLTIADDGAQTMLYRMTPQTVALGDLSPESLLQAMRG